jgi:hypothetical protein
MAAMQRATQRRRTIEDIFGDVSTLIGEEIGANGEVMSEEEKRKAVLEQHQGMLDAVTLLKSEIVRRDNGFRQQLELELIHTAELEKRDRDRRLHIQDLKEEMAEYEHREAQRRRKEGARERIRDFMKELQKKTNASSAKIIIASGGKAFTTCGFRADKCLVLVEGLEMLCESIRSRSEQISDEGGSGAGGGGAALDIMSTAATGVSQLQQLRRLLR